MGEYYTIGRAVVYEELEPGISKAAGGFSAPLDMARTMQIKANRGEIDGLPKGKYNIYELPECTDDIVGPDFRLIVKTPLGKRFTESEKSDGD